MCRLGNSRVFVSGGGIIGNSTALVECYDFETRDWQFAPPLNKPRQQHASCALKGHTLFVFAGIRESCKTVEQYKPYIQSK